MALDRDLEILIKNLQDAKIETGEFDKRLKEAAKAGKSNVQIIREMSDALSNASGSATNLYDTLSAITRELKSSGESVKKATGAYDKLTAAAFKLRNDEQGINDLSKYNLEQLQDKIKDNLELLEIESKSLVNGDKLSKQKQADLKLIKAAAGTRTELTAAVEEQIKNSKSLSEKERAIISSYYDQHKAARSLLKTNINRLQEERKISKAMGVTGAVVQGTGAFMERLGMRSGIFNDAMKDSAEEMRKQSKLLKGNVSFMDKMNIAAAGVGILLKGFSAALRDPALVVAAIGKGFLDLNKAGVEFGQNTGMAADAMSGVHTEVATAVDMLKTATSVTKELGLNAAAVFTPYQIGQISDMATLLGLSEQAAGRLGLMMKTTGKSAEQIGESVYETVSGLNAAGKSAVAPRQVLDDVLTASEDISLSLGNNPDHLAAAATAARAFGMSLSQVDKIAGSLLDFESSIEAELEAQLLTGKDINMSKARELALNNDLAGLAKELERQGVSAVEFSKMNRIQQEATAKALGMSRQELSKSLLTQEAQANMTEEQLAAARGVSLEESKRIGIQERIEKAIQKVQLAFAPVLEALVPIVENALALINPFITLAGWLGKALAVIVKFPPVLYTIQGIMAAIAGYKIAAFASATITNAREFAEVLGKVNKMKLAGIRLDGRTKLAKQAKNMTMGQTAAGYAYIAMQKVKTATVSRYNKVLRLLGFNKTKDIVATTASTTTENLNSAAKAKGNIISRLTNKLGKLSIVTTLKEAAAKLFGAKATAALNVQSKIAATSGAAGGAGMTAFAAGIAPIGPVLPIILGLSLALVGVGLALKLAAPAISAFGSAVKSAFEGVASIITAVAGGISSILREVTLEKAVALVATGAAFAALGLGLASLGASLIFGLAGIAALGSIALMATPLSVVGKSITEMAEGVAKLSEALESLETSKLEEVKDLISSTALAAPAIAATGAITSLIQGIAGTGGETDDKVVAKIQELIDLVGSGKVVELKLDSETISKQQMLSMTKGK